MTDSFTYHWRDGIKFQRLSNGDVWLLLPAARWMVDLPGSKDGPDGPPPENPADRGVRYFPLCFPANEWASIVKAVSGPYVPQRGSAEGEEAARAFHDAKAASAGPTQQDAIHCGWEAVGALLRSARVDTERLDWLLAAGDIDVVIASRAGLEHGRAYIDASRGPSTGTNHE